MDDPKTEETEQDATISLEMELGLRCPRCLARGVIGKRWNLCDDCLDEGEK